MPHALAIHARIATATLSLHNVQRVVITATQPNAGNCRKLCIETKQGWIELDLFDFQHGEIEQMDYYNDVTP